jgi:hypothetical protein
MAGLSLILKRGSRTAAGRWKVDPRRELFVSDEAGGVLGCAVRTSEIRWRVNKERGLSTGNIELFFGFASDAKCLTVDMVQGLGV